MKFALPWKIRLDAPALAQAGDRARDRADWRGAARLYARSLAMDDRQAALWVQLGHARKESGDLPGAETAYYRALDLMPADADVHLQLGHLLKLQGRRSAAAAAYARSVEIDPRGPHALGELKELLRNGAPLDAGLAQSVLDAVAPPRRARSVAEAQALARVVVFDVSDLIGYFRAARLPTGIQRVQIEVVSALVRDPETGSRVWVCAFSEERDDWIRLHSDDFLALAEAALASGDADEPSWRALLEDLADRRLLSPPLIFPTGAWLINLGTSWWLQNYFLKVREAQRRFGVRYVPFVHDMIPIMAPEHCVTPLVRDFVSWALGVFSHADAFLTNSEASRADLKEVARRLGVQAADQRIRVIPLDADFRKPGLPVGEDILARHGLTPGGFMLFVSTLESRKNHLEAFGALQRLLRAHGPERTPRLVCVGGKGWLNEAVHARLRSDPALADHVLILSGVPDGELDALYRACRFTIYPSLYEGWGLPVTESLCHGKVPLVSRRSSIPEAARDWGVYFDPGDLEGLTSAMQRLIFDDQDRRRLELRIQEEFRPRPWAALGADMLAAVDGWSEAAPAALRAPKAEPGRLHRLSRSMALGVGPGDRADEVFRRGRGWRPPETWGCRLAGSGGRLAFGFDAEQGVDLRLYLGLRGLERPVRFDLKLPGGSTRAGRLEAGERRWLPLAVTAPGPEGEIELSLLVRAAEEADPPGPPAELGVVGFIVCRADDMVARADFTDALRTGELDRDPAEAAPEG